MVGTPEDDPALSEWARYVRAAVRACGNVTELRRRSGVGRTSIYRYMNDDGTRVTIDVARRIARAINDEPDNAVRAAGSLLAAEEGSDPRLEGLDPGDEVVRHIMALDVDDEMRGYMLDRRRQQLAEQRSRDLREIEREIEFWTKRRGAA